MEIPNNLYQKKTLSVVFLDGRPPEHVQGVSSVVLSNGFLVAEVSEDPVEGSRVRPQRTEAWSRSLVSQWRRA